MKQLIPFLLMIVFGNINGQNCSNLILTQTNGNASINYNVNANPDQNVMRFFIYKDGSFAYTGNQSTHYYKKSDTQQPVRLAVSEPYNPDDPCKLTLPVNAATLESPNNPDFTLPPFDKVDVIQSWSLFPDPTNEPYYALMFTNPTRFVTDGCLYFEYEDAKLLKDNTPIEFYAGQSNNANKWVYNRTENIPASNTAYKRIKWNFSNLLPGEKRVVYIPLKLKSGFGYGEFVSVKYGINLGGCAEPVLETKSFRIMTSPHDPNYIESSSNIKIPSNNNVQKIEYTVHFQNYGSGPAQNILVKIPIYQYFLQNSFQIIDSSFPATWTYDGYNIIVSFENYNLPGMTQYSSIHPDKTMGFVKYSLCTKPNPPYPTSTPYCVSAEASIIFDTQLPIRTNILDICSSNIAEPIYCDPQANLRSVNNQALDEVTAYPNPFENAFTIESQHNLFNSKLTFLDQTGKQIHTQFVDQNISKIDVQTNNWPLGVYIVHIQNDVNTTVLKLVKN